MIPLDVVCAVIIMDEAVLLTQRPAGKTRAFLWEFPGGKVEAGESGELALMRELQEELAVPIRVLAEIGMVQHDYGDLFISLRAFEAEILRGAPVPLEGQILRWVPLGELAQLSLCMADRVIANGLTTSGGFW